MGSRQGSSAAAGTRTGSLVAAKLSPISVLIYCLRVRQHIHRSERDVRAGELLRSPSSSASSSADLNHPKQHIAATF